MHIQPSERRYLYAFRHTIPKIDFGSRGYADGQPGFLVQPYLGPREWIHPHIFWFQPLPRQDISAASPRSAAQRACPACRAVKGAHGGGGRKAAVAGRGRPSLGSRKRSSTGCSEPNATCKKAVECTSCGRCKFHLCKNCSDCEGDYAGSHVSPKSTRRSTKRGAPL